MDKSFFSANTDDVLYLIYCAFNGIVPNKNRISSMNLADVYNLAKFHSLQSVCYSALEEYEREHPAEKLCIPDDIREVWKKTRDYIIKRNFLVDIEREKILSFFEKEGVRYLPLKGIILREYYPQNGWRHLADNDILIDGSKRDIIKSFMESEGYTTKSFRRKIHDVYAKKPYYSFEMHVSLFNNSDTDDAFRTLYTYYNGYLERAQRLEGTAYGYKMSLEDYYVYMVAHSYKHHLGSGTGLRTFVDEYVLLTSIWKNLDHNYVKSELDKLKMTDFERFVRNIALKLFSPCKEGEELRSLTDEEREILLYYSSSGTYGTFKNNVNHMVENITGKSKDINILDKIRYCFKRLFPGEEFYRDRYPEECSTRPKLIAFAVKRIFRGVFVKKIAMHELSQIKDIKDIEKLPGNSK